MNGKRLRASGFFVFCNLMSMLADVNMKIFINSLFRDLLRYCYCVFNHENNRSATWCEPPQYADLRIALPAPVRRAGFRQRPLSADGKRSAAAQSPGN
ncbi:hypothetical protein [Burkholderia vietnamiensis]|uniref:hypothetical protein n=1 Tax=Burkholderia vietnamiensis TaxID=60552 RepID=UPI00158E7075|nr:hypothetical protein [Burkholderia vietnamiensis]MBH9644442.1 hypothetical protein [Burkholderia vietnamiensis]MBR8004503.1 hypothetical protein [Burkholderia vietnamiensis]